MLRQWEEIGINFVDSRNPYWPQITFPLAFGVMSLENYEDWLWFLENLKVVVGNKEVVIISYRHPALLSSVLEIFGVGNHAYCYQHLKENFSTFLNWHNTKGNYECQEDALQWLDNIAYAQRDEDEYYDANLFKLRNYNEALAKWVK